MPTGVEIIRQRPVLALVTDRRRARNGDLAAAVAGAVRGGASLVILREKDLPAGELLRLALQLRDAIAGRALLVVNDRADVALAAGADGVHLGEHGLPVQAARAVAAHRKGFLVGRSVHSAEGAARAEADGADYLLLGTIFPSASHPGEPAAGVGLIREAARRVAIPVFAIGGMTADNARECLAAGAWGVAVISALLEAPDAERAARALMRSMTVEITVNGEPREIPEGTTVSALLELLKVSRGMIAVSRNREILHREEYPKVVLQPGDTVEIVRMVGGG